MAEIVDSQVTPLDYVERESVERRELRRAVPEVAKMSTGDHRGAAESERPERERVVRVVEESNGGAGTVEVELSEAGKSRNGVVDSIRSFGNGLSHVEMFWSHPKESVSIPRLANSRMVTKGGVLEVS